MVKLRNKVREAYSGIDVQLRQRFNLLPKLAEIVKAYAIHEQGIFQQLANSLKNSANANNIKEQEKAENELKTHVQQIMNLAISYPELKANENFLNLQKTLTDTEEEIERARRYYNALVRDYNTDIEKFPVVLIAKNFGFESFEFFTISNAEERNMPNFSL